MINSELHQKIYVAGHRGMVGNSIVSTLHDSGYERVIFRSHEELNLINQEKVEQFFFAEKPDQVYLAAAKVGGIYANDNYPAEFIYDNLMIQANIINSAFKAGVKRLLFLGSSCIYPKHASQPMTEDELLTGKLEPTNEPYAIAKIAGIKLCESYNRQYGSSHGIDYRTIMPTNLYGPNDNYHEKNSHVIPAMIRRFHEAKIQKKDFVKIWGTGKPKREFLHVDDLAKASLFVMNLDKQIYESNVSQMSSHINIGSGQEFSIRELADIIKNIVGYSGRVIFDNTIPDGSPRKLVDTSLINKLGWKSSIMLNEGLKQTYRNFLSLETVD